MNNIKLPENLQPLALREIFVGLTISVTYVTS